MYAVRTWGSHALLERSPHVPTIWATFDARGDAMAAADALPFPIVDVRDIGEAGRCPSRPLTRPTPDQPSLGHRFDVQSPLPGRPEDARCMDCGAYMDELYVHGTYLTRPADNALFDTSPLPDDLPGVREPFVNGPALCSHWKTCHHRQCAEWRQRARHEM